MLRVPAIVGSQKQLEAKCKRSFDQVAHLYFINSVSMCPDQATFISADDLTVHLWNIECPDGHQTILDMRPTDPDFATVRLPALCHDDDAMYRTYACPECIAQW
jgi:hypothetical protein